MARVLLGVTGGIAAYKAVELARLAIKAGHAVRAIQTPTSQRFLGRATLEGITGAPVLVSEFDSDAAQGSYPGESPPDHAPISHLALVQRADLYVIAPASANTLAKLAHGQADNLVSTAALAADCPVVVAPAMNDRMYRHAATQANLDLLRARGVVVVEPGEGDLASHGEHGIGRLAEPAELLEICQSLLTGRADRDPWGGRRVLVTAGGTREPIDSVRYIGNRSSGRMGIALAARAAARGAQVTLVAANLAADPPPLIRTLKVHTAAELLEVCLEEFPAADVLLMAAAVADFRPADPADHKLKKDGGVPPPIELKLTDDVLARLSAERRAGQVLVGFAAEHGAGAVEYGRGKLEGKGLDAVVVNDISRAGIGFDSSDNEVVIVTAHSERRVARAAKEVVADEVLDEVDRIWQGERKEGSGGGAPADASSGARV
jgi:phosphopantothenoylcysteine decarboxylase/phosphopantothenate--cysteine ligase